MPKPTLNWGNKRSVTRRIAAFSTAVAAALSLAALSAGPAAASADLCSDNGNAKVCTNVNGAGLVIHQIVGSATTDRAFNYSDAAGVVHTFSGHVEVVNPSGTELCNSSTKALSGKGVSLSCLWHGYGETYPKGDYCTILWAYEYRGILEGWVYVKEATECVNIFAN
ncbi:hypothetical protein [Streptomyces sp. NPDC094437]|uniref:hypothetical protein n=1 Tax=Streptomyces sp. NPDC094437 TaxID=3366060 RepID=UPI0038194BE8